MTPRGGFHATLSWCDFHLSAEERARSRLSGGRVAVNKRTVSEEDADKKGGKRVVRGERVTQLELLSVRELGSFFRGSVSTFLFLRPRVSFSRKPKAPSFLRICCSPNRRLSGSLCCGLKKEARVARRESK